MIQGNYFSTLCPQCKKESPYIPNPYNLHICKSCGFKGLNSDLITVVDDRKIKKNMSELEDLLKRFPHLSKF